MADRKPNASSLSYPQAISIPRTDAYNSTARFQSLKDNETGTAVNCEFGIEGTIRKSNGYVKLDDTKLSYASATATGGVINGFHEFNKSGPAGAGLSATTTYIVGAGESLHRWTGETATVVLEGFSAASLSVHLYSACALTSAVTAGDNHWEFTHIQDPSSPSDDFVVMVNGVDPILFWNGSGTANHFSSITSVTGLTSIAGLSDATEGLSAVCAAEFVITHNRRLVFAHITDDADVDAGSRVDVTGFDDDGVPAPYRISGTFHLGGADGDGHVTGLNQLRNEIYIFKKTAIWKMSFGAGRVIDVEAQKVEDVVGCIAPHSLVNVGNFLVFLSEKGFFAYDGVNLRLISEPIRHDLENNTNQAEWKNAYAIFYAARNQYRCIMAPTGETEKSLTFVFDASLKTQGPFGNWLPPLNFYRANLFAAYTDAQSRERYVFGDYRGFIYEADRGEAAGLVTGRNATATSGANTTLTDTAATFFTENDRLEGLFLHIVDGTGVGQRKLITSNTGTVLTVESAWNTNPDSTSVYTVGGIPFSLRTKDFDFGVPDITKIFRKVELMTRQTGGYVMELCYIIDFNFITNATCKDVNLVEDQLIWNQAVWGDVFRSAQRVKRQTISLRNTPRQRLNGHYFALRFQNLNANQPIEIFQYEVITKPLGRRTF